ncbi:MAG TPA: hypothetical protein VER36_10000, partial [Flavisolibacter sp.]|nr:hypothetical protein [Flavisolibacter sp.]
MSTANKNNCEHFSFDFRKLKFDANNPGKETRKTLVLIGVFVIVLFIVLLLGIALLNIGRWTIGALGGSALFAAIVKRKAGR